MYYILIFNRINNLKIPNNKIFKMKLQKTNDFFKDEITNFLYIKYQLCKL